MHTQAIESLWSKLKTFLRRKGLRYRVKLGEYLDEFAYIEHHGDIFHSILLDVVLQHRLIAEYIE